MKIPFGKPMIGQEELRAVQAVLERDILVHGPKAKEFEEAFSAFTCSRQSVAVSSCTAGLHLAYFYLGLKAGDEVIVPSQTHCATAHAVEFCGARPVFIDCDAETGNIDISQIENSINERTKAISVVHFLGLPVDMQAICSIAAKNKLFVVEDCALAIGAYYQGTHVGLLGDIGSFSFYPVKHMTTAEGGMVVSKHPEVLEKISKQRAFGVDRTVEKRTIPGTYDVTMLGFNYRMNEIEAAIGIEQTKKLPAILTRRKANYSFLHTALKDLEQISLLKSSSAGFESSYYCLSVILESHFSRKRAEIVDFLKSCGVGTSIYYPRPVPLMSYYKNKYNYHNGDFPNAERISNCSIALPVGPHLNEDDMVYIAECMKLALTKV